MAGVDLYGGDAGRIRDTYRSALGRDASDDEVSGWLSGSYGGGGLNDWVNQISSSHEARQRNPQPQPQPPQMPVFNNQPPVVGQPTPTTSGPMTGGGDPWAQAQQGLANVYRQFLGRDPGDGDVDKWLSGQFGHGSGLGDYDKYVSAIMGSPEARAYRPQFTGQPGVQNLEYWQSQGVPAIDIFDPMDGKLRPGWTRTANGYQRTGGAPTATGGRPDPGPPRSNTSGDIQPWFMSLVQGLPPSPQSLKQLEPILNRYGIRLGPPNARGWTDGIILPDGTFYDVITAATESGGSGWAFFVPGPSGHAGPGTGGIGGVNLPGSQYSDPFTKLFEEMMLGRINSLQQGSDPAYQQLLQYLQQRFTDLQGPGRTGAEQEVIRTQALDPIESDRTAAKKRALERISAMGYTLESGVAQQLLQEIDKEFDAMRAQTQTAMSADELNRREGRNQYAEGLAMSLYGLPQDRAREAIGYAGNLSNLGPQRLQLAMQAAGMGGNPSSNFSNLMSLAQMNQQSQLYNQQRGSQWYDALGSMAAMLWNAGR